MNTFFPVGFIIPTADSRNPSTYLGGTWVAIQDRTIVGVGTHALDWTGGSETVTLTANQSGVPAHYHITRVINNTSWNVPRQYYGSGFYNPTGSMDTVSCNAYNASGTSLNNTAKNASESHNNLQPSVAKYLWQRTA